MVLERDSKPNKHIFKLFKNSTYLYLSEKSDDEDKFCFCYFCM